jgi:hypothetical protein
MAMSKKDKQAWPLDTLLICMRNARRSDNWGGTSGPRALDAKGENENRPPAAYPQPTLRTEEALYPFTKGIDLTNDGIGYGEETTLKLVLPNGSRQDRIARRTRTGSRRFAAPMAIEAAVAEWGDESQWQERDAAPPIQSRAAPRRDLTEEREDIGIRAGRRDSGAT